MKIFKNYYLRWFLWAFLVGVTIPPLLFFCWSLFSYYSMVRLAASSDQPIVFVTTPFVDLTNPISGKFVVSGNAAFVIVGVLCGLCAGVLGLIVAGINRFVRKALREAA